jgi:hypothetical protein
MRVVCGKSGIQLREVFFYTSPYMIVYLFVCLFRIRNLSFINLVLQPRQPNSAAPMWRVLSPIHALSAASRGKSLATSSFGLALITGFMTVAAKFTFKGISGASIWNCFTTTWVWADLYQRLIMDLNGGILMCSS